MKSIHLPRTTPATIALLTFALGFSALGPFACNSSRKQDSNLVASTKSTAQKKSAAPGTSVAPKRPPLEVFNIPVGPKLGIFVGEGIGPIRFGANLQTIERNMAASCTEKSPRLCRYAAHALDFHLDEKGLLNKIVIQGDERQFGKDPGSTYGIFNGRFPRGAQLGMYKKYIIETLGEPKKSHTVNEPKSKTMIRDTYPNMVLEYDKLKNSNVVLSGIILTKPEK